MRTNRRGFSEDDTIGLIRRLRDGDNDAFGELFTRYRRFAYAVAHRTGAVDIDEAVSEAFRRTLEAIIHGHGPTTAFGPYIATSVRSVIVEQHRRREYPTEHPVPPEASALAEVAEADPNIAAAFTSLPERWRDVIWLSDIEGFPPREIAKMLGMPTANSVSALRNRAHSALRAAYLTALTSEAHTIGVAHYLRELISTGGPVVALDESVRWHLEDCPECADVAAIVVRIVTPAPASVVASALVAPAVVATLGFAQISGLLPDKALAGSGGLDAASTAGHGVAAVVGTCFAVGLAALVGVSDVGADSRAIEAPLAVVEQFEARPAPVVPAAPTRAVPPPTSSASSVADNSVPPTTVPPATSSTTMPVLIEVPPVTSTRPSTTSPPPPTRPPDTAPATTPPTTPPSSAPAATVAPSTAPPTTVAPIPTSTTAPSSTAPAATVPATTTTSSTTSVPTTTTTTVPPTTSTTTTSTTTSTTTTSTTSTTTTTTTPTSSTTTTSTTIPPAPPGDISGHWSFNGNGITIDMSVVALTGAPATIVFDAPMTFLAVSGAQCASATQCSFSGISSPATVTIQATTTASSLLIRLLDQHGNEVDRGTAG